MNEWEPDATCAMRTGQQQQQRQQDSAAVRSPERRGATQYDAAGGVFERAGMRHYPVLVTSPPAGQVRLPIERPVEFVLAPFPSVELRRTSLHSMLRHHVLLLSALQYPRKSASRHVQASWCPPRVKFCPTYAPDLEVTHRVPRKPCHHTATT